MPGQIPGHTDACRVPVRPVRASDEVPLPFQRSVEHDLEASLRQTEVRRQIRGSGPFRHRPAQGGHFGARHLAHALPRSPANRPG